MALSSYPKYVDLNLPWSDSIPINWSVKRGKNILNCIDKRSTDGTEELLTVSSKYGVIPRKTATVTMFKASSYIGYKMCWKDDLVINSLWAWAGGLGVAKEHGIISSAYGVYRVKSIDELLPEYFHEFVRSIPYQWELQVRSKGIWTSRLQLTDESFLDSFFLIPPLDEQKLIVRYLKFTNNIIQKYIFAKKKLIQLLEEQKRAIIHQAVTGAIDVKTEKPYSEYKDSGSEWLGKIPIDWDIRRIKSLTSVKRGASPRPIADMKYFDNLGEYSWVRIADVTSNDRYLEHTKERLSELGKSLSVPLEPGSLFLSIAGSVGKPIITHIKCCIHDGFVYFPRFNGNPEYLYYIFASGSPYKGLGKMGTQLNLNTETVGSIAIGWPSPDIQGNIVKYLDIQLKIFNDLIIKAKSEINLIQEYRIRLVADVVTGKIDVREIAKIIPKEIEEVLVDQNDEEIEADVAELDENGSN